jgi:hypothetical protein
MARQVNIHHYSIRLIALELLNNLKAIGVNAA